MRLAPQLVLAFGFVALLSVAGLGAFVREDRRATERARFDEDVQKACGRVKDELLRQADADAKLVAGACQAGELVDSTFVAMQQGTLDARRLAFAQRVGKAREAFGLDELLLATDRGEILGADPRSLLSMSRGDVEAEIRGDTSGFALRLAPRPAIVTRCRREEGTGPAVGLVGAQELAPLLARLGGTLDVSVRAGAPASPAPPDAAQATCTFDDRGGASVPLVVTKSRKDLDLALTRLDETVLYAGLAAIGVALVLAVILARRIGSPIAELAGEARKVATGEARPVRLRRAGEVGELGEAFDKMLEDLAVTRRRLAATSRVAAWREVARRVAHEVKNPLAPIRAAVETLRRLRAREDPRFDEYFDEATRTVLDEVHRIANIVTEFTRFARLPPPRPQEVDVMEIARGVVQLQKANAGQAKVAIEVRRVPPLVRADRDQIVQVLTNLVQNALDAVEKKEGGEVRVVVDSDQASQLASITVRDNGPGIAPEIAARLFEPYATTKAHGTGLGLAIAQRIAMEHNGELALVQGEPGRGAVFRLVLPVEGPPPSSADPPPPASIEERQDPM